jgi:hypothetical protein
MDLDAMLTNYFLMAKRGQELPNMANLPNDRCSFHGRAESLRTLPGRQSGSQHPDRSLKTFAEDRKGHDQRCAIDETKARRDLGYAPCHDFVHGLASTLRSYLSQEIGGGARKKMIYGLFIHLTLCLVQQTCHRFASRCG